MPLSEVLKSLSAQSGVALDGGELATAKRVTLSVRDMELRTAMAGLADLYQADWPVQGENNYLLKQREMLPWRRDLIQLGNINDWGFYRTNWSRPFAPPYLTTPYAYDWQALLDNMDTKALESPAGVPFSSLPLELQQEIRRATSWEIKHQAVEGIAVRDRAEGDWTLRIVPENYPNADMIEFFKAPIPNQPGPPIVEIVSDSTMLAAFPFRAPAPNGQNNTDVIPGNHVITGR